MKFTLEFHPLLRIDVIEASLWYEKREAGLGARLEGEVKALFRQLADGAMLQAVRFESLRRASLH